jgi:hypothetical protein
LVHTNYLGWAKSKRENRGMNRYHKKINSLYDDGKFDENDIPILDRLKMDISDGYAKGKINDQHYNLLNKKIESFNIALDNKTNGNNISASNQMQVSKRSPI